MTGRLSDAEKVLVPMAPDEKFGTQARLRLAAIALQHGRLVAARQQVDAMLSANPNEVGALISGSRIALAEGKLDEARTSAEKAVALQPDSSGARLALARALLASNQTRRGGGVVFRGPASSTDEPRASHSLGTTESREGTNRSGARIRQGRDDECSGPRAAVGTALRRAGCQGHLDEAERTLAALSASTRETALVQNQLGRLLLRRQQDHEAIAAFARARSLEPKSTDALSGLVQAYLAAGRRDEVRRLADQMVAQPGVSVDERMIAARAFGWLGLWAPATREWQEVINTDPSQPAAYEALGRIYVEQKRLSEAEEQFQRLARFHRVQSGRSPCSGWLPRCREILMPRRPTSGRRWLGIPARPWRPTILPG